jgi:hypothetical protein
MMRAPKNRRQKQLLSVSDILSKRRVVTDSRARLGQLRRLYTMVVGPTLAKESTVIAYEAHRLVIGVPGKATQRQLESLQSFLVRTINERMGAGIVNEVRYIQLKKIAHPNRPVRLPVSPARAEISAEQSEFAETAASSVADPNLREQLSKLFKLMMAQSEAGK